MDTTNERRVFIVALLIVTVALVGLLIASESAHGAAADNAQSTPVATIAARGGAIPAITPAHPCAPNTASWRACQHYQRTSPRADGWRRAQHGRR